MNKTTILTYLHFSSESVRLEVLMLISEKIKPLLFFVVTSAIFTL